jgi:hypothetical protein
MSMHGETSCPEEVLASIAWYPDALDDERRGLVEAHAASCPDCRDELAFVQGASEPEAAPLPGVDAEAVYARVLSRIEASEERARPGRTAPPRRARSLGGRDVFGARPAALAAAVALAILCGTLGVLGGLVMGADAPVYQTAQGAPEAAAAPAGPRLEVVLRPDARAEQVQAALRGIGAQVVSGPTQLGVYRLALPVAADAAAAAQVLQGEGRGVATFAQLAR